MAELAAERRCLPSDFHYTVTLCMMPIEHVLAAPARRQRNQPAAERERR